MPNTNLKDIKLIINDPTAPGGIKGFNFNQTDAVDVANVQLKNDGKDTNIVGEDEFQTITFTVPGDIIANLPDGKSFKFNDKSKSFTVSIGANGIDASNLSLLNVNGIALKQGKITNLTNGTTEKDAINFGQLNKSIRNNNIEILTTPANSYTFKILEDLDKNNGYGDNKKISYFGITPNQIITFDKNYGKLWFVHKTINSTIGYLCIHKDLMKQWLPNLPTNATETAILPSDLIKVALGKSNQIAPDNAIWNIEGLAVPNTENANNPTPTKWVKADGTLTENRSEALSATYSSGSCVLPSGEPLAKLGFLKNNGSETIFTEDSSSDYFCLLVTAGGGTFSVIKAFQLFQKMQMLKNLVFILLKTLGLCLV